MELPDDVLALIREYARPVFTYFREYNGLLKLLKKKEWPALKKKLQTDPEVLPALLAYQTAVLRKMELYQEMEVLSKTLAWQQNRYYNIGFYCRRDEEDTFWVLNRLLHNDLI